jgi:hypothetical protein
VGITVLPLMSYRSAIPLSSPTPAPARDLIRHSVSLRWPADLATMTKATHRYQEGPADPGAAPGLLRCRPARAKSSASAGLQFAAVQLSSLRFAHSA